MSQNLTKKQERSFNRILDELEALGYSAELLRRNYSFEDWFESGAPERTVEAAAFARQPYAYDTACFAVAASNGGAASVALIRHLRALGAPRSFEVDPDGRVYHWRVSQNPTLQDRQGAIEPGQLASVFAANRERWSPDTMYRQRARPLPVQLDFIDAGLIPALEEHIREKLGPRLENILGSAIADIQARTRKPPNLTTLFRLIFRGIAGKVLHDRNHTAFKRFRADSDPDELFTAVADHYGESPATGDRATRRLVYEALWSGFNLRNISVDVLAFLYEDFLVTPQLRQERGIHATPPSVARYVVNQLPFDEVQDGRTVVEPCCGGAAFLVASLQRFGRLLPRNTSPSARHEYVRSRLFGADLDTFALEVARCSLMLSDYPNRNGWQLEREDVFGGATHSPKYHDTLARAKIVLCNPRFEDFNTADRRKYKATTPRVPAELIHRILECAPADACLGLVLPTQAVDGKSYSDVREQLASRFADLELVHLPDDTFKHAELPTVLLLAREPGTGHSGTRVSSGTVTDFSQFARTGSSEDRFVATRSVTEASHSLDATRFWEVWKALGVTTDSRSLEPHRGVEWKSGSPIDRRVSDSLQRGYRSGYHPTGEIACYEHPALVYLNPSKDIKDRNAWELSWDKPKVVLNRARASRGHWRLAAIPVHEDRVCSENFITIWPPDGWTPNALAAVLNGPVVSAFVFVHDRDRDNKAATLARAPLPTLDASARQNLDAMVTAYLTLAAAYREQATRRAQQLAEIQDEGMFATMPTAAIIPEPSAEPLRELLVSIDSAVLAGYRLPPPLERDVVNFFRGHKRPLPFDFADYETRLIRRRLEAQTQLLDENPDEQRDTWEALKVALDEDRLSKRKLFS